MKNRKRKPYGSRPRVGPLPVSFLIVALGTAMWGTQLEGRPNHGVRATLAAIGRMLGPARGDRSGVLVATVNQIADHTGYSSRWVWRCLGELERRGILEWHRGGVLNGKPVPSTFIVSRTALAELTNGARPGAERARDDRRAATAERVGELKTDRTYSRKKRDRQKPRSQHVEPDSSLPPSGAVSTTAPQDHSTDGAAAPRYLTAPDGTLLRPVGGSLSAVGASSSASSGTSGSGSPGDVGPDDRGETGRERALRLAREAPDRFRARTSPVDARELERARAGGARYVVGTLDVDGELN